MINNTVTLQNQLTEEQLSILQHPDQYWVQGFGTLIGYPKLLDVYRSPSDIALNSIANAALNLSADLSFNLLSTLPASCANNIFSIINYFTSSFFSPNLQERIVNLALSIYNPLKSAATITGEVAQSSKSPPQTINLLTLIVPALFLHHTIKKVINNVGGIFKSLPILSKGIFLGQWTHETYLTNPSGRLKGYNMSVQTARKYSPAELGKNILTQTLKAGSWGMLAYITQKGMRNAIANVTKSETQQDAITLLTTIIVVYNLFYLMQNNIKIPQQTSSKHENNEHSYSYDIENAKPTYNEDDYSLF